MCFPLTAGPSGEPRLSFGISDDPFELIRVLIAISDFRRC